MTYGLWFMTILWISMYKSNQSLSGKKKLKIKEISQWLGTPSHRKTWISMLHGICLRAFNLGAGREPR